MRYPRKSIYLYFLSLLLLCLGSMNAAAAQDCVAGTWQSPPNDLWDPQNGSYPVQAETQHFQLRYAPASADITPQQAEQGLAAMESIFAWFVSDTVNWPTPYCNETVKYKAQIFANDSYGLSGAGAGRDVPAMWVGAGAIRAAARGDVSGMVHEFTHSMQFNSRGLRGGQLPGWVWEGHAEFMAHQYPNNRDKTGCTVLGAWQPHLYYGTTRTRYCAWMFWDFVKNELGFEAVNRMWTSTAGMEDQDPLLAFRTSNGLSQPELQDLFGRYAMANVNWDYTDSQDGFDRGSAYRATFGPNTLFFGGDEAKYLRIARMEAIDVEQRRFIISDYFAPQRYGYNHVRLMPDSDATRITIDFRGVVQDAMVPNADIGQLSYEPETPNSQWANYVVPRNPASNWRWGIVAIDNQGESRSSPMISGVQGQLTFDLNGDEREVYLAVAATPDEHHSIFWDQKYHTIYRYPYTIQLAGAMPEGFEPGYSSAVRNGYPAGRVHPNGGGWVANEAQVDDSVFVGPNAAVIGGTVLGNARIEDYATVWSGEVRDNAVIGGLTQFNRNFTVAGNAEIRAVVGDGHTFEARTATVNGNTKLFGDLILSNLGDAPLSQGVFSGLFNLDFSAGPLFGANRTDYPVEVTAGIDKVWPDGDNPSEPVPEEPVPEEPVPEEPVPEEPVPEEPVPEEPVPEEPAPEEPAPEEPAPEEPAPEEPAPEEPAPEEPAPEEPAPEEPAPEEPAPEEPAVSTVTLAASYVSPWEDLGAVNNRTSHTSSADKNGGAYGNWRGADGYGQTDWVSFSWDIAQTLGAFEVYWWNDGLGISTPNTAVVDYWDGSSWISLGNIGVSLDQFNRLEFAAVSTTSIRVSMSSDRSTGILEARVFGSSDVPDTTPPVEVPETSPPADEPVNVALTATLQTSFESAWRRLSAVNNATTHTSSADTNGGAYSNWRGLAGYGQTEWVSFNWDNEQLVSGLEVYWWDNGFGVATPTSAVVEYWDGSDWVSLGNVGVSPDRFNRIDVDAVSTSSVRVSMFSQYSTGILEARVWGESR